MNSTRRLTVISLLSVVAFGLMIFPTFPLIPGASFLKIDFSIVPIVLGALMLDLRSGYMILFLRTLLKLLLNNQGVNDYIGLPMNIISMGIFLTIIYLWLKRSKSFTIKNFTVSIVLATLGLTLAMVILNYFYAVPLYAMFANFDIKQIIGLGTYMLYMVVPFNLAQGVILGLATGLVYSALRPFINRTAQELAK